MKIYIIGCPATGKTTMARILSKKMNIKSYELDLLIYDDENNHTKRTDEQIDKLFNKILKETSWIIEDVGRNKFLKGRDIADKIYYIKLNKLRVYKQAIIRWIKQRIGILPYNYPPTILELIYMLKIILLYFKKENKKLEELEKYSEKMEIIDYKKLKKLKNSL